MKPSTPRGRKKTIPARPSAAPRGGGDGSGLRPRRLGWRHLGQGVTLLVLLFLLGMAARHIAHDFNWAEIKDYLGTLAEHRIWKALLFTAASYMVMTLYDVSALKYLRIRLPYSTVGLGSFAGYAISNNVGFAVISGGSVRYRVYSAAGLSAADIAKIVVFSTSTFTLGITFMGSAGVLAGPSVGATLLGVPPWLLQGVAGVVLAGLAAAIVATALTHKPVRLWRWEVALPSSIVVLSQILIASMEIGLSAAALWILMPPSLGLGFMDFLALYCAGLAIAIVSHVPGGLGVFESILLLGLQAHGSTSGALGALLAFRAVFYLLPLLCAGLLLLGWEIRAEHGPVAALRRLLARRAPRPPEGNDGGKGKS